MLGIWILVKSDLDVPTDVGECDKDGRGKAQNTKSPAEQFVMLANLFQLLLEPPVRVQVRMNSAHNQGRSLHQSFSQRRIGQIAEPGTKRPKVKRATREMCHRLPPQRFFCARVRKTRRVQQSLQHVESPQTSPRRLNFGRIARVIKSVI